MRNETWADKHYAFFTNRECEYFPCHPTTDPDNFNCLFCYCPLYVLGENCGGNFEYLPSGVKNCAHCAFPHQRQNYGRIISRYAEILAALPARQKPKPADPNSR
jgi:Zn-finger protein